MRFRWLLKPLVLRALIVQARLPLRLLREPQVPTLLKFVPLLGLLYLVSPIDFVPDFLPVLGQLDDMAVIVAALQLFVRLCPTEAQEFHREAITRRRGYAPMPPSGEVFEAEWRHS
jgi:uncharacterized membrane protein YkvA (DUF1232 family)